MAEIVQGTSANNTNPHVPKHHSRFPLKEVFFDTHRFGEYHPHFVVNAWESEKHPVRCVSDTRSWTLKAPLMQDIVMNKDYFMVTQRAILPFQSERVRMNPNIGDDVPTDAYTSVSNFVEKVADFARSFDSEIASYTPAGSADSLTHTTLCLKKAIFLESIFSRGSLLASLGSNLSSCLTIRFVNGSVITDRSIDKTIDECCRLIAADIAANGPWKASIDSTAYTIYLPSMIDRTDAVIRQSNPITLRDFMQKIRDTSDWLLTANGSISYTLGNVIGSGVSLVTTNDESPMDLARLWAYQLACAEYFSNDKVDYIYSADLFRQYIHALYLSYTSVSGDRGSVEDFQWNGMSLEYDYLSAHYFDYFVSNGVDNLGYGSVTIPLLQYFLTLFGYKRSLRFKDYFTGARTRPLALVGNSASGVSTDVPVVGGNVSVIDVTRSIQAQRFLNAVNASGRKFSEWIQAFFGVTPNKDMHEPIFLAHSSDNIFAADNENTGNAVFEDVGGNNTTQNNVTAVFRGRSNNYEYSVEVKEPCIIIGVTSYDIERLYPDTIHRDFFIRDRYDMFNPMMQFIGDQPIYLHELEAGSQSASWDTPFGYTFRDMQWKTSFPRCAGAFGNGLLPGYAFVYQFDGRGPVISPDFIRAKNAELDEFYLALTGYSLGTYFHFIMRQVNVDDSIRPMVAKPQIL